MAPSNVGGRVRATARGGVWPNSARASWREPLENQRTRNALVLNGNSHHVLYVCALFLLLLAMKRRETREMPKYFNDAAGRPYVNQ